MKRASMEEYIWTHIASDHKAKRHGRRYVVIHGHLASGLRPLAKVPYKFLRLTYQHVRKSAKK